MAAWAAAATFIADHFSGWGGRIRTSERIRPPVPWVDLTLGERPVEKRREALKRLVGGVGGILFCEALAAEGAVAFSQGLRTRP